MPRDPITLLSDIRTAAEFILEQTRGHKLAEYESDRVLSAAVERHFITIGEALNRLVRVDETTAASLGVWPGRVCSGTRRYGRTGASAGSRVEPSLSPSSCLGGAAAPIGSEVVLPVLERVVPGIAFLSEESIILVIVALP